MKTTTPILPLTYLLVFGLDATHPAVAAPQLAHPEKFTVELYADFSSLGGNLKAFGLTLTAGEPGFPAGLYVTSGPSGDSRSDRLVRVSGSGQISIVRTGLVSNEQMIFAKGNYGQGMLVTIPRQQRIVRIPAGNQGPIETFASGFTPPFGPSGIWFDLHGELYTADNASGNVMRVAPDGALTVFASVPIADTLGIKGGGDPPVGFGTNIPPQKDPAHLVHHVGTFTAPPTINPPGAGAVYEISSNGTSVVKVAEGFDGLELLVLRPRNAPFPPGLYLPTIGGAANGDGALYVFDGTNVTAFMTGLDAVSVAFDTNGILGGGMFVSDINDAAGAGKIWRVVPVEPIPTLSEWGLIVLCVSLLTVGILYVRRIKSVHVHAA